MPFSRLLLWVRKVRFFSAGILADENQIAV